MTYKVIFFGTPEFSIPTLQALIEASMFEVAAVVTAPDKARGRGQKLQPTPIKKVALASNLPVIQPEKIKKDTDLFIAELKKFGPIDFGVVVAFGQILPQAVLDYPRFGCLNIHASLLPRWRGAAPLQRAILAGDKESGICIMQMESGLDTGPVFASDNVEISETTDLMNLHDQLSVMGAKLLLESMPQIASAKLKAYPQAESGITYAAKITPAETRINWSNSAEEISRQIRGFSPFPGAYTFFNGKRLKIYAARVESAGMNTNLSAGSISGCNNGELKVQCASGALLIESLQLEGKRKMDSAEFLRGYNLEPGDQFE